MWFLGPAIGALGGAVTGALGAGEQRKGRQQDLMRQATETRYSPWVAPQQVNVRQPGSTLGQSLGGAFSGGMMGAQFADLAAGTPGSKDIKNFTGGGPKPSFRKSAWDDPANMKFQFNRRYSPFAEEYSVMDT